MYSILHDVTHSKKCFEESHSDTQDEMKEGLFQKKRCIVDYESLVLLEKDL